MQWFTQKWLSVINDCHFYVYWNMVCCPTIVSAYPPSLGLSINSYKSWRHDITQILSHDRLVIYSCDNVMSHDYCNSSDVYLECFKIEQKLHRGFRFGMLSIFKIDHDCVLFIVSIHVNHWCGFTVKKARSDKIDCFIWFSIKFQWHWQYLDDLQSIEGNN